MMDSLTVHLLTRVVEGAVITIGLPVVPAMARLWFNKETESA